MELMKIFFHMNVIDAVCIGILVLVLLVGLFCVFCQGITESIVKRRKRKARKLLSDELKKLNDDLQYYKEKWLGRQDIVLSETIVSMIFKFLPSPNECVNNLSIIEKKQCYKNATLVEGLNDEIHFIDGKINFLGIPIEHAWNEYHGQYFDVTKEIALKESVDGVEYLSIGEFTYDYVIDVCFKRKFYGSILYEYFTSVNKNDNETDVKFKK